MNAPVEFAQLWQSNLPGIELFNARLVHHAFAKHMHEEYTIGINQAGEGCFSYRGNTWHAYPGSFNLINPGEVHTGQAAATAGWTFRNLYITVTLMEQVLTQLSGGRSLPHFSAPVVHDPALQTIFHTLFRSLSKPTSLLTCQSLLLEGISRLLLQYGVSDQQVRSPKLETRAVTLIRAYLEAHYAEPITIETLAQLASLSPYYLIRSFQQQVGLPPHQYQRHWQLMHAKRSLRTTKPLAEIAAEHGFYDQSHFNRIFKRAFGITPGQYRNPIHQGNSVQYENV